MGSVERLAQCALQSNIACFQWLRENLEDGQFAGHRRSAVRADLLPEWVEQLTRGIYPFDGIDKDVGIKIDGTMSK